MNESEQKTQTTVTTEIAHDLRQLTETWQEEFDAASDRLDLHQRQIDECFCDGVSVRLELDRLEDAHRRLKANLMALTEPLRRVTFTSRLRWLVWGY